MNALRVGTLLAGSGVALGAFGAHALRGRLSELHLGVFETGVRYQLFHAAALLILGVAHRVRSRPQHLWVGRCFILGSLVFSGSLYLLATTGISKFGAVTPIGGVLLLAGWATWARAESKS